MLEHFLALVYPFTLYSLCQCHDKVNCFGYSRPSTQLGPQQYLASGSYTHTVSGVDLNLRERKQPELKCISLSGERNLETMRIRKTIQLFQQKIDDSQKALRYRAFGQWSKVVQIMLDMYLIQQQSCWALGCFYCASG